MSQFNDAKILESWRKNASSWVTAVREGQIDSRKLVTNRAIVEAIVDRSPRSVLDLGCGEGWLARELAPKAIQVVGIDVVPDLIEQAKSAGGGDFRVASYEQMAADEFQIRVDVVVSNFALFGSDSVEGVFRTVPTMLNTHGTFMVQTLHPLVACGALPYQDGWREGSWNGFGPDFTDPAPWYFRTLENWKTLFAKNGFSLLETREPIHPTTREAASVIFIAKVAAWYQV